MDNPETLATWGTQATGRRQIKHNTQQNTTQNTINIINKTKFVFTEPLHI
jgi:hypothetical protein